MSGIATAAAALLALGASWDDDGERFRAEIEVVGIGQMVTSAPVIVAPATGDDSATTVSGRLRLGADLGAGWSASATIAGWEGDGFRNPDDLVTLSPLTGADPTTRSPVNGDLAVRSGAAVSEVYLTAATEDARFRFSLGKVDTTTLFCVSSLAGNPASDFTNYAFRSSTAIQYPGGNESPYTPAAWMYFRPSGSLVELTLGWAAMQRDEIDEESYLFAEARVNRPFLSVGLFGWRTGGTFDVLVGPGQKDDPSGVGAYVDWRIRGDFSVFAKAAFADDDVNVIASSWSTGLKVVGNPWNRPADSVGIAYARSVTSDNSAATGDEGVFEAYYRFIVMIPDRAERRPQVEISPHYQSISNAGGIDMDAKTNIFGVRIRAMFVF
jgi:hypothetical protein